MERIKMRKPILKEIREHIQHPRYGDKYIGDWSILKQQQRDDIFILCQYTESLENIEIQLIKENKRLINIITELECWLKLELHYNNDINEEYAEAIKNTLNKLKGLKEGK